MSRPYLKPYKLSTAPLTAPYSYAARHGTSQRYVPHLNDIMQVPIQNNSNVNMQQLTEEQRKLMNLEIEVEDSDNERPIPTGEGKIVKAYLKSISPYGQSRAFLVDKMPSESHDDYEKRSWRNRIHANNDGSVFIPPMVFKKALDGAAKYGSLQIPGKGKSTYTKFFESGTLIMDPVPLPLKKADVIGEWLFLDANGKKGKQSSGRVLRCMPRIESWEGEVIIFVIDETVLHTKQNSNITVLEHFLKLAGSRIGIGRFRPENGGFYGRFSVSSFKIQEIEDAAA